MRLSKPKPGAGKRRLFFGKRCFFFGNSLNWRSNVSIDASDPPLAHLQGFCLFIFLVLHTWCVPGLYQSAYNLACLSDISWDFPIPIVNGSTSCPSLQSFSFFFVLCLFGLGSSGIRSECKAREQTKNCANHNLCGSHWELSLLSIT